MNNLKIGKVKAGLDRSNNLHAPLEGADGYNPPITIERIRQELARAELSEDSEDDEAEPGAATYGGGM